jgi:CAAX protease family protein
METIMIFIDHLLAFVLLIVTPVAGYFSFQRLFRRVDAGKPVDRTKLYKEIFVTHWALFFTAIAIWVFTKRSFSVLGFDQTIDIGFMIGAALAIAGIGLLLIQSHHIRRASAEKIHSYRKQLGRLEVILPRNGNELGRFYWVSLTAGIVEETLWRGFMIWYFSQFLPLWAAALISVVGFGIAHAYQGIANLPKVTLVSAALVGLYLLTGSLWLPIVLHAATDVMQGRLAYEIMRRDDDCAPMTGDDSGAIASA